MAIIWFQVSSSNFRQKGTLVSGVFHIWRFLHHTAAHSANNPQTSWETLCFDFFSLITSEFKSWISALCVWNIIIMIITACDCDVDMTPHVKIWQLLVLSYYIKILEFLLILCWQWNAESFKRACWQTSGQDNPHLMFTRSVHDRFEKPQCFHLRCYDYKTRSCYFSHDHTSSSAVQDSKQTDV